MRENALLLAAHRFERVNEARSAAIAKATAQLALAAMANAADGHAGLRISLSGGLGAGKTTWVREFLRACGVSGRIKSPSFSVVETYEQQEAVFHHFDFYRQTSPTAWQAGGLRDLLTEHAIVLIEWPEHAQGLPPPHIEISIGWPGEANALMPRTLEIRFFEHGDGIEIEPYLLGWEQSIQQAEHQS